jgi:hypothetical protein
MKAAKVVILATVWVVSLFLVRLWAQTPQVPSVNSQIQTTSNPSTGEPLGPIVTGDNIGLQRLAGPQDRDGKVRVRWMIKLNGEWREAVLGPGIIR